jgi:hypothetical protein
MAVLGTVQMAGSIAQTILQAHLVQQNLRSQVLNALPNFSVLVTIRMSIFFINK